MYVCMYVCVGGGGGGRVHTDLHAHVRIIPLRVINLILDSKFYLGTP